MNTSQIQLKLSLSQQLNDLLEARAARLGVPVTQFVKHLILKEVDEEAYPSYQMSEQMEKNVKKAMEEYHEGKAIRIDNISEYFKNL